METDSKPKKQKANSLDRKKWILFIWIFTFVLSAVMTVVSSEVLRQVNILVAVIILLVIILVSIIFDMIGTAVTAATEIQFHSMAARKVRGAKSAIRLIRNADKVSNFCNDVVGDVCGIVSGAASTYVVIKVIERGLSLNSSIVELAFGGVIAALTVGGKAIGKSFAITNSNNIIYRVASIISFFKRSEHK